MKNVFIFWYGKQDENGEDCESGRKMMHFTHLHDGRWVKSCKEGMSGWEDEWRGTRNKKRWADEHKCMKRWVDECDVIKKKPQESLIQN